MGARWISFDCYGTLVDWSTGFSGFLQAFAGAKTPDLLRAYHRAEPMVQAARPFQSYRDVLVQSLRLAAREVGVELNERQARTLPERWASLPVFPDVDLALSELRAMECRIAVLTNCDDDLFALTQRSLQFPFDHVVTAQQVRDYKPSPTHFRTFERAADVNRKDWVHVASSWFHDLTPARELGISHIWLDRDQRGDHAGKEVVRVLSATALPAAVRELLEGRR